MDQIQNNNKRRSMTQRNSRFLLPHNPTSSSPSGVPSTNAQPSNPSSSSSNSNTLNLSTKNNLDDFQFEDNTTNQHSVDTDFDSYWEEEARCPHRNRIRIGRQYQPSVPAMLKPGESDNRDLKDLETLTFCPKKSAQLSDAELDHYFTIAKSLNLFASLVETRSLLGRDVTIADLNRIRHKEGLSLASVIQPTRQCLNANTNPIVSPTQTSKSPPNSNCESSSSTTTATTTTKPELLTTTHTTGSPTNSNVVVREPQDNYAFNLPLMKALSHFINLHHPCHHDRDCKKLLKDVPLMDDSGPAVSITAGNLRHGTSIATKSSRSRSLAAKQAAAAAAAAQIVKEEPVSQSADTNQDEQDGVQSPTFEEWTREEVELFSKAIEVCGKNFSSIKKEFLPSKSVKSIVEYYYIGSRDVSENKKKQQQQLANQQPATETSDSCSSPEKLVASSTNPEVGGGGSSATGCQQQQQQQQQQHQTKSGCGASGVSSGGPTNDPRMSVYNFDEEFKEDSPVRFDENPGAEVKPLKAKPIIPNSGLDGNGAKPNVGSLEFFMDGQLVLKLNACQDKQEGMEKCHWVQSGEKVASERRQKKYTKRASDKLPTALPTTTTTTNQDAYNNHHQGDLYDKVLFDQRR